MWKKLRKIVNTTEDSNKNLEKKKKQTKNEMYVSQVNLQSQIK